MALNSLTDRMSEQIDEIVRKRQQNWDYIKRAHQGQVHWLNVVKLTKSSIIKSFPPDKLSKRIRRWFMLGLSFGRLLELSEGATMVRALGQLIEEYEHFIAAKKDLPSSGGKGLLDTSSAASSDALSGGSVPFLFLGSTQSGSHMAAALAAVAAAQQAQLAASSTTGSQEAIKPTLKKVGKEVVYEYLQTHTACMPDHLDYCEIVHSLCDCLCLIYSKFLDPSCQPTLVHDAILRLDRKMKTLILSKITTDLLTEVGTPLMKNELLHLLNHQFVDERHSTGAAHVASMKKFYQLDENNSEVNSSHYGHGNHSLMEDDDDEK